MKHLRQKISAVAMGMAVLVGCCVGAPMLSANAANSYSTTIAVQTNGSALAIEPTLILEPQSFDAIDAATVRGSRPASVILTPDETMNVTLGEETLSLANAFDQHIRGKFIPVVRLDGDTVDAFIEWMNTTYTITDMMAISSDISVIEKLYADDVCYLVNTVYDLTSLDIPSDRYAMWEYVAAANKAGCNILMLDAAQENLGVAAEYISALTKVCWAYSDDTFEAVDAIAAGCYGIVADDCTTLGEALAVFNQDGFARAQYIAAHRGITAYANENSLTAIAASYSEGATHVEIDLQVTSDGKILICHNSDTNSTSDRPGFYFSSTSSERLSELTLEDYSRKYEETFPTLEEVFELMSGTDVILILELKMDGGSTVAVDELEAIRVLRDIAAQYPEMDGHWYAITFYEPYALGMRELMPEVPVGFLGAARSGKEIDEDQPAWDGGWTGMSNVSSKIAFMRKYNMVLDESYESATDSTYASYLARGYTQNTWTFQDKSHFSSRANIATSDAAEACAMYVKEIAAPDTVTAEERAADTVTAEGITYCGWQRSITCSILPIAEEGNTLTAVLYYSETDESGLQYGIYSRVVTMTVEG